MRLTPTSGSAQHGTFSNNPSGWIKNNAQVINKEQVFINIL